MKKLSQEDLEVMSDVDDDVMPGRKGYSNNFVEFVSKTGNFHFQNNDNAFGSLASKVKQVTVTELATEKEGNKQKGNSKGSRVDTGQPYAAAARDAIAMDATLNAHVNSLLPKVGNKYVAAQIQVLEDAFLGLSQEEFFSRKPKFDQDFDELKTKLFLYIAEVIRKIVYSKELDFEEIEMEQLQNKYGAVAVSQNNDWTSKGQGAKKKMTQMNSYQECLEYADR